MALVVSALAAEIGGLPLWLLMLRRACRDKRPRLLVYLLAPILAPAAFLAGLAATAKLAGQPDGLDVRWFATVTAAGFVFAALAAVGPGLALRGLRPRGPALRLAAIAGGVAAATMAVAAAALVVAVISLCRWNPWFAASPGYAISAFFCALVVAAATVATVSAARGLRAWAH